MLGIFYLKKKTYFCSLVNFILNGIFFFNEIGQNYFGL